MRPPKQHGCFTGLSAHFRGSIVTNAGWAWAAQPSSKRSFPAKALCLVLDMPRQAGQAEVMLDSAAAPACCLKRCRQVHRRLGQVGQSPHLTWGSLLHC